MLVLIAGYTGYVWMFESDETPVLRVVDATGSVTWVSAAGERGEAAVGLSLQARDTLAVGDGGRAVLGVGDDARLTLSSSSSIRVLDVDRSGVRVELEEGRVQARVRPGSPSIGVSNRGRSISATDAVFDVAVDAEGALAAQTVEGEVAVQGFDEITSLPAGDRLRALPGEPAVVAMAPEELLLELAWPEEGVTREAEVLIEGRTDPYAEVRVGREGSWTRARAGPDGRFRVSQTLVEGENPLEVEVRDAMGDVVEARHTVVRDSTAPTATRAEVLWGR